VLALATSNPNKVREMAPVLRPALHPLGVDLRGLADLAVLSGEGHSAVEIAEDRATFAGNAAVKAFATARGLGLVTLGEDSGLSVDALGGEPGVRSARWSGKGTGENNRLLLEKLAGVPEPERRACFTTVAVLKVPAGPAYVSVGRAHGMIGHEPRGEHGFGYDPVFVSRDLGCTFGEAPEHEKLRVSHRSKALRALRAYLFEVFAHKDWDGVSGMIPGYEWCTGAAAGAGAPAGLMEHQTKASRLCREMAFLLVEAGYDVDVRLVSAAGLLHDIGRLVPGLRGEHDPNAAGVRPPPPPGVTPHAWLSGLWASQRGLDERLVRAVTVHGLDSLLSDDHGPSSWEERVLMLADKLVERDFVGLEARLESLARRYPDSGSLIASCRSRLCQLEENVAGAAGISIDELRRDLASCLDVVEFPAAAGVEDVEKAIAG